MLFISSAVAPQAPGDASVKKPVGLTCCTDAVEAFRENSLATLLKIAAMCSPVLRFARVRSAISEEATVASSNSVTISGAQMEKTSLRCWICKGIFSPFSKVR